MEIKQFIAKLEELQLTLVAEGEKLVLKSVKKNISENELNTIKQNKEITDYIRKNKEGLRKHLESSGSVKHSNTGSSITSVYRLSGVQQGLLFHGLYDKDSSAYIVQLQCDIKDLDVAVFIKSWNYLVKYHSILRTGFRYEGLSMPVQCVYEQVEVQVDQLDYRSLSGQDQLDAVKAYVDQDQRKPFTFHEVPLMRLTLLRLKENDYKMVWTFHHMILDGWSVPVLMEEFLRTYETLLQGDAPVNKHQDNYEDYIRYLEKRDTQSEEQYWRSYLSGLASGTLMPVVEGSEKDRTKGVGAYDAEFVVIENGYLKKLREYVQQHHITVNTLMQGVWGYLLSRYSGSEDVLYGVTVSGRPEELGSIEQRVGMYINTFPVRIKMDRENGIDEWFAGIQRQQVLSRRYQYSSLSEIREWLQFGEELFDTILVFENFPVSQVLSKPDWSLKADNVVMNDHASYPLIVTVSEDTAIRIRFDYNTTLVKGGYVKQIAQQFSEVLEQIVEGRVEQLRDMLFPGEVERAQLVQGFGQVGSGSYDVEGSIVKLFERTVAELADMTAVHFSGRSYSYQYINEQSNKVAHWLRREYGVEKGKAVGMMLERSDLSIIGVIGVLKSGGILVPVDPGYPVERKRHILKDADCVALLTGSSALLELEYYEGGIVALDIQLDEMDTSTANPAIAEGRNRSVYILYTSGSTGRPKGVEVGERSLLNYILWSNDYYFTNQRKYDIALFTSLSFDLTLTSILPPLLRGSAIYVYEEGEISGVLQSIFSPGSMVKAVKLTPSHIKLLGALDIDQTEVSVAIVGGEALGSEEIRILKRLNGSMKIYNEYGPTEATIGCVVFDVDEEELIDHQVPIGRCINNSYVYVLNEEMELQPAGCKGELWIGGLCLSKGYYGDEEQTAARFKADPFRPGCRLYATGDIVRYRQDGVLEYFGRADDQVKLRGYRIELGEIERVLQQTGLVKQCVVIMSEDNKGDKQLLGYIVPEVECSKEEILAQLRKQLPAYMIPAMLVEIDQIPLTVNGKTDRRALPKVDMAGALAASYAAPRNRTEEVLCRIWQDVLGVERVGINDNFFELGGHSLRAVQVVSRIHKELGIKLELRELFGYPRIADLSKVVSTGSEEEYESIVPSTKADWYELSHAQRRLYILDRLEPDQTAYNIPGGYVLEGPLDVSAFKKAFEYLVDRHEILRTVFEEVNGVPRQRVLPMEEQGFVFEVLDLRGSADKELRVLQLAEKEAAHRFNLSEGPLVRAVLLQLEAEGFVFLFTLHHIISDGWSMEILTKEVLNAYEYYRKGDEPSVEPLKIQYKDYANWQHKLLSSPASEVHRQYWLNRLSGELPLLELPADHERPLIKTYQGGSLQRVLDASLTKQVRELALQQGASVFMVLLASVKALLYRYTGQKDMIVGTVVAGRDHKELEDQVGFYVNTLALRNEVHGEDSFVQLLDRVKENVLEAYAHQVYPFDRLVDELSPGRDMSRHPLFDVMVILQNAGGSAAVTGITISEYDQSLNKSKFDLTFSFMEAGDEIQVYIEYNKDIFEESSIDRIVDHYRRLLKNMLSKGASAIGGLPMLSDQESNQLLKAFNNTSGEPLPQTTLVAMFEEQVRKTPDAVALVFEGVRLTYGDLNARANQLGHYLRQNGVREESLVGICMERSLELVVGILGILKSGAVYVPIDGAYPEERIKYMLEDSGCGWVLINGGSLPGIDGSVSIIDVQALSEQIHEKPAGNITTALCPEHAAYVIYTSGSTGRPKGVIIQHQSIVNTIIWRVNYYNFSQKDSILQIPSIAFDSSVEDFFCALTSGAMLVIPAENKRKDIDYLKSLIAEHSVTHFLITPLLYDALINELASYPASLRVVTVAGDAISKQLVQKHFSRSGNVLLVNEYGPTESSVCTTAGTLLIGKEITIGKPISNVNVYILNEQMGMAPVGVTGEIYIGGAGLCKGYLNSPELNEKKLIHNPFRSAGRLYRTGDIGRWLADGNIEFLGRVDEQVKLRGYRIELGEIESALQRTGLVKQSVVIVREDSRGDKQLIGYVVPEGKFNREAIVEKLRNRLPEYMIPVVLAELDQLPLTINGKIDRRALPEVDLSSMLQEKYVAPRSKTEKLLCGIWQKVLGVERIGIYDNFFELGGHSLRAVQVVSHIHKELGVKPELRDLFAHPFIAALSKVISGLGGVRFESIERCAEQPYYELSHAQRRLWILDRLQAGYGSYNIPGGFILEGGLDVNAFKKAFAYLIGRHEVLRTVFVEVDGEPRQRVLSMQEQGFVFEVVDLQAYTDKEERALQIGQREAGHRFNLSEGPLVRAVLLQLASDRYVFLFTLHHIISDGWSMEVLTREVLSAYESYQKDAVPSLPALSIQYKDYANWQNKLLGSPSGEADRNYWLSRLSGELPVLELPADHERPRVKTYNGGMLHRELDASLTRQIKELALQQGASLFMVLLASVKVLLYRYTGQQEMIVGTTVAGRDHIDLEDQIGFYVNMMAVRSELSSEESFEDLLARIKQNMVEDYAHQAYPFDRLVDELSLNRDMSRNPLFDVVVGLLNTATGMEAVHEEQLSFKINDYSLPAGKSKFDLTINFTDEGPVIRLHCEYNKDIFEEDRIERLLDHYRRLVGSVVLNSQSMIGELQMLSDKEEHQLLHEFNKAAVAASEYSIISLFEQQVSKTPEAVALVFEGKALTYQALNERANQIGHYLRSKGVGAGQLVGLCVERSLELISCILGILKTGAGYVPIDPSYPVERISYMLADSGVAMLLSNTYFKTDNTEDVTIEVIELDRASVWIDMEPIENVGVEISKDNTAYVMYTSGSTGRPKGVEVTHGNVVSLVSEVSYVSLNGEQRLLSTGSLSFDATTFEYWGMLLNGGRLVLCPRPVLLDSGLLKELITAQGITMMWFTSGWFNQLVETEITLFDPLQTILVGGDKLSAEHIKRLQHHNKDISILNGYGPTENTTFSLVYRIEKLTDGQSIPIGRPMENRKAYILDKGLQLCGVGVAGEICVGGAGLSRGYWRNKELTDAKFIEVAGLGRLYRTGDIGRWSVDGNIEFFGRNDDQVKLRGYRIELGEIESALQRSGLVKQSVVIVREDGKGDKQLVGYVVPEGNFNKEEIVEQLQKQLPDYMVPAVLVSIEQLPLTVNGKVDRKALPEVDMAGMLQSGYVAPRNKTEALLCGIWQEVLGVERIGINDNFFELGGDSIITIQAVSRIRGFGYRLQAGDIFEHPTIASLSGVMSYSDPGEEIKSEQGELTGEAGLLPIQHWFFESGHEVNDHFNQSGLFTISKQVSVQELQAVFDKLYSYHDALRFSYHYEEGKWVQRYSSNTIKVESEEIQACSNENILSRCRYWQQRLSIGAGSLIRVVLFTTGEEESHNRLFMVVHHLGIDGVSWRILLEDIELLINDVKQGIEDARLTTKSSSYREWYNHLVEYGNSDGIQDQLKYWAGIRQQYKPLKTDSGYSGDLYLKDIDEEVVWLNEQYTGQLLQGISTVYHTSINDILLLALCRTLCNWQQRSHVVIGFEGHGREEQLIGNCDLSRTVGWFTTLYPVLLEMEQGALDTGSQVKSIKEQLGKLPDKGLSYGVLKYLHKDQSVREHLEGECWDVVFNYLGQADNVTGRKGWLKEAEEDTGEPISEANIRREKLEIVGIITGGRLRLSWGYSKKQYNSATISAIAVEYTTHLQQIIAHCVQKAAAGISEYTPSDYGMGNELTCHELDKLLKEYAPEGHATVPKITGIYRLSGVQMGILFHRLYDSNSSAYIVQMSCDIKDLEVAVFIKSWEYLIRRHSILRTGFHYEGLRVPVQCVYESVDIYVQQLDYRFMEEKEQAVAVTEYLKQDQVRPFSFREVPLMRLSLLRIGDRDYKMVWTFHHILLDGWSVPVLMEEFLGIYEKLIKGKAVTNKAADNYDDYIKYLERRNKKAEEQYWKAYLSGVSTATLLPMVEGGFGERTKGVGKYGSELVVMNDAYLKLVKDYVNRHQITINTLMQGVWGYLLSRYADSEDVLYGVTVSGRPEDLEGIEQRVGMYINTFPVRIKTDQADKIGEWLAGIQRQQVLSRKYQYSSLSEIREWLQFGEEMFDTILVFENYPVSQVLSNPAWSLKADNVVMNDHASYPLIVTVSEDTEIRIRFDYNTTLLKAGDVTRIAEQFRSVLTQIVAGGAEHFKGLLKDQGMYQLQDPFNAPNKEHLPQTTIVALFEEQVRKTPDAVAVVFEGKRLTYSELNERSNQLGHYLRQIGVGEEALVGICMERSLELIIGILGILKSGGMYLPIDGSYPEERIRYMLENSGCGWVLVNGESLQGINESINIIDVQTLYEQLSEYPVTNVKTDLSPEHAAYIIYTSGSTGKPKGVIIEHKSVVNRLLWTQAYFNLTTEDAILQKTNYCFDVSVWEFFWPLMAGARLVIASPDGHKDPVYLQTVIEEEQITTIHFVPSMLDVFLSELEPGRCTSLRRVLCSGEALKESHRVLFENRFADTKLYNLYGPTEAAIDVSCAEIVRGAASKITIGRPVSNTRLYILDKDGSLAGCGNPGELYIGGIQVARGYVNRVELTDEKFIKDPYSEDGKGSLYRTGDICRWLPEGEIEYISRKDDQIKIRGFRVEPGEIEYVLEQTEGVKQSVVIVKEDSKGDKQLIAYVVPEGLFNRESILDKLRRQLPDYMIPVALVGLDQMPLSVNGKVDRRALPLVEMTGVLRSDYIAPRNKTEEALCIIWQEVLGVERVGIYDNFFELGGHSLKAIQVVSRIHKELGVKPELRDLFSYPRIAELSKKVSAGKEEIYESITPLAEAPWYELSHAQRRLWVLDRLEPDQTAYNMPGGYILEGRLDVNAFKKAFEFLVSRHEVLRTVFEEVDGVPRQRVLSMEKQGFVFEVLDLREHTEKEAQALELASREAGHRFNLSAGPLVRAKLLQLESNRYVFLFTLHHIISDGWSMEVLTKEVLNVYESFRKGEAPSPEPLRIQYRDYAGWQHQLLNSPASETHRQYWLSRLSGELPVLELPTDHERPKAKTWQGGAVHGELDAVLTKQLKELAVAQGASVFMILLATVKVLLYRYTGQEDLIVGTIVAGRDHKELEDQVGFYVNTLALRNEIHGADSFGQLLGRIKENVLEAYAHQVYPFDRLVDELSLSRDMSRHPLFDVMVILQNARDFEGKYSKKDLEGISVSGFAGGSNIAKCDLGFLFEEVEDRIAVTIEYDTDIFLSTRMQRLLNHYLAIVNAVVNNRNSLLKDVAFLPEQEREWLLNGCNQTDKEYKSNHTLVELFEAQVVENPDKSAIIYQDRAITYRELNEYANGLAKLLSEDYSIQKGAIIGVHQLRSEELVITILALWKLGAIYLPVDIKYPEDRIRQIIKDSALHILIQGAGTEINVSDLVNVLYLNKNRIAPTQDFPSACKNEEPAYAIFTSGTTGVPKGVLIAHRSIADRILYHCDYLAVTASDRMLNFSSIAFDAYMVEVFMPLIAGGVVVITDDRRKDDLQLLEQLIIEQRVSIAIFPPSYLELLSLKKCISLKKIISTGERADLANLKEVVSQVDLYNGYGPTETCIGASFYKVDRDQLDLIQSIGSVPIGKPFNNTKIYLLDRNLSLVPRGGYGEIYVGGIGVGLGYLNNMELTREKFLRNIKALGPDGSVVYKTGDIGRWNEYGLIEFKGRIDNQVQVRGIRVELDEIQRTLNKFPGVRHSQVIADADTEGKMKLIAFYVADSKISNSELRSFLGRYLPAYMVPNHIFFIETLPLTPNGKVDQKQLKNICNALLTEHVHYEAPRNKTEALLCSIWQEVLGVERIGINDNFFELGGHSLRAVQVVSRIHKELGVKLELRELFNHPFIADLSKAVEEGHTALYESITHCAEAPWYELSHAQRRLWILDRLEPDQTAYNIPGGYILVGRLDVSAFRKAFEYLIDRHEILRTVFEEVDGIPRQRVLGMEEQGFEFEVIDLREHEDKEERVLAIASREAGHRFNLSEGPLVRAKLLQLEEDRYVFLFTLHHIISDGWSMEVLTKEVLSVYESFRKGEAPSLSPLRIQYRDYASWQHQLLHSPVSEQHRQYWLSRLSGELPVLELPTDHERPKVKTYNGGAVHGELNSELTRQLKELAVTQGASVFMLLLATVKVLLYRYTGQEDLVVGTVVAGRDHKELEDQVGFYVNTLALRNEVHGADSFEQLLVRIKENVLEAYAHQVYPFDRLVDELSLSRDMSRHPLFDVMVLLQNTTPLSDTISTGLQITEIDQTLNKSKFDLTFSFLEGSDRTGISIEYNKDLFEAERISRMLDHYLRIVKDIAVNAQSSISRLTMLSGQEVHELLHELNKESEADISQATLVTLFEEQVGKTPDAVAVVFEGKRLTYGELNERANQLGHYLRQSGVREECLVGICMERSPELIIGILGILKSGGVYIPIDGSYPEDRIKYLLEDSSCRWVLSNGGHEKLELVKHQLENTISIIDVQAKAMDLRQQPVHNVENVLKAGNAAYIIYTSGSTGMPKGVIIEHQSIVNRLLWTQEYFRLTAADAILQKTNYSFDVSVWEFFWPLLAGARLVLAIPGGHKDSAYLRSVIAQEQITTIHFVPSMLEVFLEDIQQGDCASLRKVLCSGESLKNSQRLLFEKRFTNAGLYNLYGPTEAAIDVTCTADLAGSADMVTIGKPVMNTQMHVLDSSGGLVARGNTGELYIGGVQLARGYVNRVELTEEKFIADPYSRDGKGRLYRTGDLGRWLADGNIEFLGRADDQVKIRGYRVEPGEIESALQKIEGVKQAVVIVRNDSKGDKQLIGYIVPRGTFDKEAIREHLQKLLPEYMIPAVLIEIEQVPITVNGKIDRRALPEVDMAGMITASYVAPRNYTEEVLCGIWQEVLGTERVGINDNFFELGGHSIRAVQVVSRIHKELGVKLELRELFSYPRIEELGKVVAVSNEEIYESITTIAEAPWYELSHAQRRLWILDRLEPDQTAYNIPGGYVLEGQLDVSAFKKAFEYLIDRHEILRTVFEEVEGIPRQRVLGMEEQGFEFEVIDLREHEDKEERVLAIASGEAGQRFNLSEGPLVRAKLLQQEEDRYVFLFTLHHIISDGWSMEVLTKEVLSVYESFRKGEAPLSEPLRIQYRDYASWQHQLLHSPASEQHRQYWLSRLSGELPVLELPTDHERPKVKTYNGGAVHGALNAELTRQLKELAVTQGASVFMLLLATVKVLLYRYTGQEDLVVGTVVAGRDHKELEDQLGFYVNTLALRNEVHGADSFEQLLVRIKENVLEAYAHQVYPFDRLVDELSLSRDMSRHPLFDVMVLLQNTTPLSDIMSTGLQITEIDQSLNKSKFDLTFSFSEGSDRTGISIEYNKDLFTAERISRMLDHYLRIVKDIAVNAQSSISRLTMLSGQEVHELLHELNKESEADISQATLVTLFEEQVGKTPDAVAVVFEGKRLTYGELNERANQLGHYLRQSGVREESLVGICMERSPELIIGILGILKSGGVYIPIDGSYPEDRIKYLLEDSSCRWVLSNGGHEKLELVKHQLENTISIIDVQAKAMAWRQQPVHNVENALEPGNAAYVIYTSGSTGMPKGVIIEHQSIVNRLLWTQEYFRLTAADAILQKTNYSFDVSVWEFFWPLLAGARLVLAIPGGHKDSAYLRSVIAQEQITTIHFVPSMLEVFLEDIQQGDCASLRKVLCSGESLKNSHRLLFEKRFTNAGLYNLYGPTEAAIDVTCTADLAGSADMVTIGKPVMNTQMHVLDSSGGLVARGNTGELYIGGVQLARGYVNRVELTEEKFIADPYSRDGKGRLYRTGDLGRWLADGNIEFLGRADDQVKIRGYRVEPGEIESALQKFEGVKQTVVIVRNDSKGDKQLIGYIVPRGTFDKEAIREHLQKLLPEYMIPAVLIEIEQVPITVNGKIDRRALPEVDMAGMITASYVAPRNYTEEVLCGIWQEVLGTERVGINDNFFELGGHSIKAVQVVTRLYQELGIKLNLSDVFIYPSIEKIAFHIQFTDKTQEYLNNQEEFIV